MKIYPVIHVRNEYLAISEFAVAQMHGADGVFFISHHGEDDLVMRLAVSLKPLANGMKLGVNLLSTPTLAAAKRACEAGVEMFWADDAGVTSAGLDDKGRALVVLSKLYPATQVFASVAFKYQPVEADPAAAAKSAQLAGFIPTTSGAATGCAPAVDKIQAMSKATSGLLAVASGMTPENIAGYAPHLSHCLVATGVSIDNYRLDPVLLVAFIANAQQARYAVSVKQ